MRSPHSEGSIWAPQVGQVVVHRGTGARVQVLEVIQRARYVELVLAGDGLTLPRRAISRPEHVDPVAHAEEREAAQAVAGAAREAEKIEREKQAQQRRNMSKDTIDPAAGEITRAKENP